MFKYLFLAIAAAFILVNPAQAKITKVLKTKVDLYERLGQPESSGTEGFVVIDTVTVNRSQPAGSGDPATMSPVYSDVQIGWFKAENDWEYLIVLKGTDIEQFVRDAITLGFNRAGYAVLPVGDTLAATAPRVNVEVTSLWMWAAPTGKQWGNHKFYFYMGTVITSNAPELANIGIVQATGYRKGQRPRSWKSYRNTALHSIKNFINNFEEKVRESVEVSKITGSSMSGDGKIAPTQ